MLTGTKVIHIAERDTQITAVPKQADEFVNTWSVDGFYEEGVAPAELGWGTHEKRLPPNAFVHSGEGPCNQICIARPGMETWVRSWVPAGEIRGMVIRHGEAFTMCDHLTVNGDDGNARVPPDGALRLPPVRRGDQQRARAAHARLGDAGPPADPQRRDHVSGRDELGVLLMGHPYRSWWTGSLLSIDEARAVVPEPERDDAAGGRVDHRRA